MGIGISTTASEKIGDITLYNQMKRNIPKLFPLHQTSQIFIALSTPLLQKNCRLMIATLHFNENSSGMHPVTKEGNQQYKISFPKVQAWACICFDEQNTSTCLGIITVHTTYALLASVTTTSSLQ